MQSILETHRLRLTPLTEADGELLVTLDHDPGVMRFLDGGTPPSRARIFGEILPSLIHRAACFPGFGHWIATEKSSGTFVGWFEFRPEEDGDPREAELGYRLRTAAWGRGYATEGSRALIRAGFTGLGVRRAFATTMAVNLASRRVMEKAGLTYVRTVHDEYPVYVEGAEHGDVEYAVLHAEWSEGRDTGPGPRTRHN
ncbi:GNAT family N-acetyltransferase [Streptomyces sp. NPDC047108]|uniref:GNAT family N-acetyltransferase n=1 Tax=Streptomyces sp. NPDC047108 TaxID=3155025 RepID=UPI0033DCA7D5